jgi:rhamnosyltransferase
MRYRIHESNQVGANSGFKAYQKRLSVIKNGWYRRQVELNCCLNLLGFYTTTLK